MSEPIRLQKFISECGAASRRGAEELIKAGKVRVNGAVVKELGTKVDPVHDRVQVRNQIIKPPEKGILLLHKPRGVVSTLSDPEGRPTVGDFLTKHYRSYFPVGRLDWDSSGLMIMTNDGELAQRLMHPKFGVERTYHVRAEGSVPAEALKKIGKGVTLSDGPASARTQILRGDEVSTWLEVTVTEGRNRLVRRLFERIGHAVMKLRRVGYGPFKLGKLQTGQLRKLTEKEYLLARKRLLDADSKSEASSRPSPRKKTRKKERRAR